MSEIDELFTPIPDRPRLPQVLQAELNLPAAPAVAQVEVSAQKSWDFWSLVSGRRDFWVVIAIFFVAIIYLLFRNSKQEALQDKQDLSLVDKLRAAAAAVPDSAALPLDEAPSQPRLHPNSVPSAAPASAASPAAKAPTLVSKHDPASLRELGTWLRAGLAERGVSPAATTQIVTAAIRSIMAEGTKPESQQQVPQPQPQPQTQTQQKQIGVLDVRGQPIPVEPSATTSEAAGVKQGKINAETDPRLAAMLKARGLHEEKS